MSCSAMVAGTLKGTFMPKKLKTITDAVEILHRRYYEGKPSRLKELEEARAKELITRNIRDLKTSARLTGHSS